MQIKSNFAVFVSTFFHPIFIPSYLLGILFGSDTYFQVVPFYLKKYIFIVVLTFSLFLPLTIILLLKSFNIISNLQISNRRERVIPFAATAVSYSISAYLFSLLPNILFDFIKSFMLSSAVLVFSCSMIYTRWKISAHLLGLGGLMAALYYYGMNFLFDLSSVLAVVSLAAGITAYARLKLNEHKPSEVYKGFLLGFFGMFFLLILFSNGINNELI